MISLSYYKNNDRMIYFYISWWLYLYISLFKEMNKKLTRAWSWILNFFSWKNYLYWCWWIVLLVKNSICFHESWRNLHDPMSSRFYNLHLRFLETTYTHTCTSVSLNINSSLIIFRCLTIVSTFHPDVFLLL